MRCFSTNCSFFSTPDPESADYSLSAFDRLFSRKNSKTATSPTAIAPAMKRIGEYETLTEGAGIGGEVEPYEGWICTSLPVGSINELMGPAKNRTNAIARTGASRVLMVSWLDQPLYVILEGCSPLFNAIFYTVCSNFRTALTAFFMVGLKLLEGVDWNYEGLWWTMNPKKC